jgi:DNA repair protein RecO (recombination protein O)
MKTEGLTAWLLHQRPSKNTTTEVFFLTRERGMARAFCRGGRTPKKRAILQPFTPLWLVLDERHYGAYVSQLEIAAPSMHLMGETVLSGLYINELLYRALKPDVAEPMLYAAYEHVMACLARVTTRTSLEIALRQFERTLIQLLGYHMSCTHEARSENLIMESKRYRLLPGTGFVLDEEQGFLGEHILAMASENWHHPEVLRVAKIIMRRMIDYVLDGAVIQTRCLYASVANLEEKT